MTGGTRASEFEIRLLEAADTTERMLESLLTPSPLPGETVRPPRFLEAMRYASLGGARGSGLFSRSRRRGFSAWTMTALPAPPRRSK